MGIQENEKLFFAWDFEFVLGRFFWNSEFVSDDSISHYLWDKMHPEYNFLSGKSLRDQASGIHKNNFVMGTEYRETSTSITRRNNNRSTLTNNGNNFGNIVSNENIVPDEVIVENIPNEIAISGKV